MESGPLPPQVVTPGVRGVDKGRVGVEDVTVAEEVEHLDETAPGCGTEEVDVAGGVAVGRKNVRSPGVNGLRMGVGHQPTLTSLRLIGPVGVRLGELDVRVLIPPL